MTSFGKCLCGSVAFEITGPLPRLYRCHCSLCRRQSGADANASLLIRQEAFRWTECQEAIASYVKPTGFRSDFCRHCGSPVPNPLDRVLPGYLWVPAGLLEEVPLEVGAHLCLTSRASWDRAPLDGALHDGLPEDLQALLAELYAGC